MLDWNDDHSWEILLDAIREEQCVFLLGPNMLEIQENGTNRPLHPFLVDKLMQEHKQNPLPYYEQIHAGPYG